MWNKLFTIARYTFTEFLKGRILYITLMVGAITILMTYIATEFTYGVPEKIALDFGLGTLSISSLAISIFMGVSLLSREIDSRTVYMIISRPVPRYIFISGKIVGLLAVLVLNIFLLVLMSLTATTALGGKIEGLVYVTVFFILIEAIMMLLVVVFMSLFTNSTITVLVAIFLLISGYAIKETQGTLFVESRPLLKMILETYHMILPAFYKLNFKDFVGYDQNIEMNYILSSMLYAFLYITGLYFLILHIFNKKNLN